MDCYILALVGPFFLLVYQGVAKDQSVPHLLTFADVLWSPYLFFLQLRRPQPLQDARPTIVYSMVTLAASTKRWTALRPS